MSELSPEKIISKIENKITYAHCEANSIFISQDLFNILHTDVDTYTKLITAMGDAQYQMFGFDVCIIQNKANYLKVF